jgi:DNA mismatch repair protein MSH6
MARGIEGNEMSTPRPSQKKQPASGSQSNKNQKSILGFFQKKSTDSPSPAPFSTPTATKQTPTSALTKKSFTKVTTSTVTPTPSSDAIEPSSPIKHEDVGDEKNKENGLHSPVTLPDEEANCVSSEVAGVGVNSPSRKVRLQICHIQGYKLTHSQAKKTVNYAESDDDDEEDEVFKPIANNARKGRANKRRKISLEDSDDEFDLDVATQEAMLDEGASSTFKA